MTNVVASKVVPIAKITVPRDLDPDDDLTHLAQNMKQHGQSIPLLVNKEYRLIDGLRRLKAAQQLGWERISVIPASMYPDACAVLLEARKHGVEARQLTGQRIFEISREMLPISMDTRRAYSVGVPRGVKRPSRHGGRQLLIDSLGVPSLGHLQAVVHTHNMLQDPEKGELAARLLRQVAEGDLTYFGAETLLRAPGPFPGSVTSVREQERILEEATTTLGAVLRSLDSLGPPSPKLNQTKLEIRARELAQIRGRLARFVRLLTKEIEKR